MRRAATGALIGVGTTGLAARASAQASLSLQGFGFPAGQMSTRTLGAGGSLAEIDPLTPVNPASVALLLTRMIYAQADPEFRSVHTPNGTDATRADRFPNFFGAIPIANGFVVSLGSSSLLDRTGTTTFASPQVLSGTDTVLMTTKLQIQGAMNDVQLAAGWSPTTWFRFGLGAHAITGRNLVTLTQSFDDTVAFATARNQRILSFGGSAASVGVQFVAKDFTVAGSARQGGTLSLSAGDTILSHARVPNRFGASVTYTGIANSFISVRTAHDNWSVLGSLGNPGLQGVDGWDTSIGADIAGPKLGSRPLFLRAGFRDRTLPFTANASTVTERSESVGLGTLFAQGRVLSDFALIHANRTADVNASESAWTLSIGLSIRP
jgi:hypothetical protein